jgi:hypothetical protein
VRNHKGKIKKWQDSVGQCEPKNTNPSGKWLRGR